MALTESRVRLLLGQTETPAIVVLTLSVARLITHRSPEARRIFMLGKPEAPRA